MKNLFVVLVLLSIISCSTKNPSTLSETHNIITEVLAERVSSIIKIDEDIVIRFKDDFSIDQDELENAVDIKPRVLGELKWLDEHSFVFEPNDVLSANQQYSLLVDIGKLLKDDHQFSNNLIVNFRTSSIELQFGDVVTDMKASSDGVDVEINGQILSNQRVVSSKVEKLLKMPSNFRSAKIDWVHNSDETIHEFTISGLQKKEVDQSLTIKWDGTHIDKNFKGLKNISIKRIGTFEVEEVTIKNFPDRHIMVVFSKPLLKRQNLNGLILLNNEDEDLKSMIDGNKMMLYPSGLLTGTFSLSIDEGIASYRNENLRKKYTVDLSIEPVKPQLRLAQRGVIVPPNQKLTFPFEAINIDTVDLEIFKIYDQNVLQYMQDNDLSGDYNIQHVGTIVHQEKIAINDGVSKLNSWRAIDLDLKNYLQKDANAIYQIRIGFRPSFVNSDCSEALTGFINPGPDLSIMRYQYYGYEGWDNPCSLSFYSPDKFVKRNVLLSNIGAIVKGDLENVFHLSISSLISGEALTNAKATFYDAQKIELGEISSDKRGLAKIKLSKKPSFAVIEHTEGVAYLNLRDANSLSLSDFDVGGKKSKNGMDAMMYTDRGVYRPGDTVHMHVMLEAGEAGLPVDHPISLAVKDPQGQLKFSQSVSNHIGQIYTFNIPTERSDATGPWRASVTIGDSHFSKRINIETIKPNRLRLDLTVDDQIRYADLDSRTININSSWLHGAPAANLRTKIDATWRSFSPQFDTFKKYTFVDPARKMNFDQTTLFDDILDGNGGKSFELKLDKQAKFPSMLFANLTSRVFEKGGDFSESYSTISVSPYTSYVGIKMPINEWGSRSVKIGDKTHVDAVVVDEKGEPVANKNLSIGIYDIKWEWWYYRGQGSNIYELNSDQHNKAVVTTKAITGADGKVNIPIITDEMEYGRKLVRVCDIESGHCTGQFFYATGWRSNMSDSERNSLSKLSFSTDKASYETKQNVILNIPSQEGAKILISIESEDQILIQDKIDGKEGSTVYKFEVDKSMAPNVYAHVSLVQPYLGMNTDLPIRMYGVLPIFVSDPNSVLIPKIDSPVELKPEELFNIEVSEEHGRPMYYTISIVDEGLLDLTNFKTPDPHEFFYSKRSLGIKTWDIYDKVLYGLNGLADKIVSIGGDGENEDNKGVKNAIRFKPVVFSAGPFKLEENRVQQHTFNMPNYIGSVRAMIVARHDLAFGSTEVAIPVKTPLMILPTVPRVISQGEEISIPVSVFALQDDVRNVQLELSTTENLIPSVSHQDILFESNGEQVASFDAKVGDKMGIAKIDVNASSRNYKASQQIEVDIRNPNPIVTEVESRVLKSGEIWSLPYKPTGVKGSNEAVIELSTIPAIRLAERVDYLVKYPYGCLEQTTSSAFAQLYLDNLTDYVSSSEIDRNVKAGIKRIAKLQSSSGSFMYWPGNSGYINDWSSSYAGHFLLEAQKKGHFVSSEMIRKWVKDQKKRATRFKTSGYETQYGLHQALLSQGYRLYTLALYGSPDLSAMNILRSQSALPKTGRFLLAAAYALSSKSNIALDIIKDTDVHVSAYRDRGITYGSELRDMALISEALSYLDRKSLSFELMRKIADKLNSDKWYSTQSIAFGLMSIGRLSDSHLNSVIEAQVKIGKSNTQSVTYDKSIFSIQFDPDTEIDKSLKITNNSEKVLFASVQLSGQQSTDEMIGEEAHSENIDISVTYKNMDGSILDVSELKQGTDFLAEINIKNLNTAGTVFKEMALSHIVPSGWEIRSGRLNNNNAIKEDAYKFRDIRDDRVHTFFDLGSKKKFVIMLSATYAGEFFLPPVHVEAMYDKSVSARSKGGKVKVVLNQLK